MRLPSHCASATFVAASLSATFVAASLALSVAISVAACGGGEEGGAASTGAGGQLLNTTAGRGGTSAMQTGIGGSVPSTAQGGPTVGAAGGQSATTAETATGECVSGGTCSLDVANLARDGLKQCASAQVTCYCAVDLEGLTADDAYKLLSGGTSSLQGTWTCDPDSRGGSQGRGSAGAGGTSTTGTNLGRAGSPHQGTSPGRGSVSTPTGDAGASTSTSPTCPATTPQHGTACTLDGYHCSTCICAGGAWTCS